MNDFLKSLISKLKTEKFDLNAQVKKMLDEIISAEVEVKQPKDVKGVQKLLCAMYAYKI